MPVFASKYIPLLLSPNPDIQKPPVNPFTAHWFLFSPSPTPIPHHLRVYFRILLMRLTDDKLALLVEAGSVNLILGGMV